MKRVLGLLALGFITIAASAQWSNPAADIPAYNAEAPAKPLPRSSAATSSPALTSRILIR